MTLDELQDVKITDRYYTQEEYKAFNARQKAKLYLLRQADGRTGGKKGKRVRWSGKGKNQQNKRLKKLERTVAAMNKDDKDNSEDKDSDSEEEKSNRTNSALTHQKK